MSRGEEQPWFQDGLAFTCTQCGACCTGAPGYVWVDERGDRGSSPSIGAMSVEAFGRSFLRQVGDRISLIERPGGDCIFWDRRPAARSMKPGRSSAGPGRSGPRTSRRPRAGSRSPRGLPGLGPGPGSSPSRRSGLERVEGPHVVTSNGFGDPPGPVRPVDRFRDALQGGLSRARRRGRGPPGAGLPGQRPLLPVRGVRAHLVRFRAPSSTSAPGRRPTAGLDPSTRGHLPLAGRSGTMHGPGGPAAGLPGLLSATRAIVASMRPRDRRAGDRSAQALVVDELGPSLGLRSPPSPPHAAADSRKADSRPKSGRPLRGRRIDGRITRRIRTQGGFKLA